MSVDWEKILNGCRRREEKAQRDLYNEMSTMVFGVCRRYSKNRADAQDLMQDVFIKVFEKISMLKDDAKLAGWIYKLTENTCIEFIRRSEHEQLVGEEDLGGTAVNTDPYTMEEILAAVQKLSPTLRAVFNLCDVEGYSLDEAAERLGSNNQAVRVALCRARKELKERLVRD